MVRVFDGQDWSVGPPLPTPVVCDFAVSSAGGILAVADHLRKAYVLRNGTWRTYSCEETELAGFSPCSPNGICAARSWPHAIARVDVSKKKERCWPVGLSHMYRP